MKMSETVGVNKWPTWATEVRILKRIYWLGFSPRGYRLDVIPLDSVEPIGDGDGVYVKFKSRGIFFSQPYIEQIGSSYFTRLSDINPVGPGPVSTSDRRIHPTHADAWQQHRMYSAQAEAFEKIARKYDESLVAIEAKIKELANG